MVRGLTGRVAIVTGAAAGIGLATAIRLTEEGALVVGFDRDGDGLRVARDHLHPVVVDLADPAALRAAVDEAGSLHDRLDIVVNNASVALPGSIETLPLDDWQHLIDVNLRAAMLTLRYALPRLRESDGAAVVNVSSLQGMRGFAGWAGYAATKAALLGLTRQSAVELAPQGIRVNAVAPATIATPMNEKILREAADPAAVEATWNSLHPLGRIGRSEEVAAAIAFLVSSDASFITGHTLTVDGGAAILGASGESS